MAVYVRLWMPNRRRKDADNCQKAIGDAMNGVVVKDDSQISAWLVLVDLDRENPRTELAFGPRRGS